MALHLYHRMRFTGLVVGILANFGVSAQYCMGGPSSNADSNIGSVQITGVASSINYSAPCPGGVGVDNLTSLSVTLNAGSNYNLYVQFSTCGGNYWGSGQAWIDFNKNFVFEPTEALGNWTGTPPVAMSNFAFTVPAGATSGVTRMRVTQEEGASLPLDPCASFIWGSVMDFSVNIQGGVNCTGYTGDIMADAIAVPSLPFLDTNNTSVCYNNDFTVYNSPDVYYRFVTTPAAYDIHISTCNSSFDTYISLLDKNGNLLAYNDDGFVCGNNSDIFYPHQGADTFYVVVEGWNMSMGQYILEIEQNSGLGIESVSQNQFTVYPNPAQHEISFAGVTHPADVIISDMSGKTCLQQTLLQSKKMDVSQLPPGIYLVQATIPQKGTLTYKLVIQR